MCVLVWRLDQIKIVDNANRQVGLSVPHALTTGGFLSFYLFAEDNLPYCVITEWNVNFCCSLIRKRNESIKANEVHDSLVGALFSHLMSRCETRGVLLFTLLWVYILISGFEVVGAEWLLLIWNVQGLGLECLACWVYFPHHLLKLCHLHINLG